MRLSRYEQEVVILLNAEDDAATVYSANPAMDSMTKVMRKMDALVKEFPDIFRITRQTDISRTYELPKKLVRIGRPREISLAQEKNLKRMCHSIRRSGKGDL